MDKNIILSLNEAIIIIMFDIFFVCNIKKNIELYNVFTKYYLADK